MEGLSNKLEKARQMDWIQGFRVGSNAGTTVNVSHLDSHLLYADDTLIFCEADKSQVFFLNLTLQLFEALSRLHVNKLKSIIYPVNNAPNLEEVSGILGCSIRLSPYNLFRSCT